MKMKTGTVKWFNLQKGHGFIQTDDGGPNIFVDNFAVECAGMHCLTEGQRIIFEIRSDKRTGSTTARSLAPLEFGSFRRDGQPSNRRASAAATAARWPFRNNESVRYHFRHDLVGVVDAFAAVKA